MAKSANHKGALISFDGLDSSGKATQVRLFVQHLQQETVPVSQFETPDYKTESGKNLKLRLQGKLGNWQTTPWEEKAGYFADNRMEHRDEVMQALHAGAVVVYDRYVPSSLVFMEIEAGPGTDRIHVHQKVEDIEYRQNKMPRENLSIFLDVPPQVAVNLLFGRKERRKDEDEYTDKIEVQQKLYNAYLQICEEQPERIIRIECVEDGKLLSPETIAKKVWTATAAARDIV